MRFEIVEIFAVIMFFISFYGLITSKNAIKSIVFIVLMEASVIMFFLSLGYSRGILPPIGENLQDIENIADPLPQALMLTAIIIGLAITAINITMLITLFRKVKSTDWDVIKEKSME
ncbi:MAG: cation:proton antiporter subunit C [Defluviitaleaceae bacterium]|nr:cation:proton antiporter subunit C [Defluviitaleaceae bacterium]